MRYPRTLLKTLAILGPMTVALSSYATEPAQAWDSYVWCNNYYDPGCAYPYPYGGFFFGDNDHRRFHHRFDHDHHFDHGGFHRDGMGHGAMTGHGGGDRGGSHR
jgi:hypothetical protein